MTLIIKRTANYFFFTLAMNLYKQLHYTYGHLGEWHLTFLTAESFVVLVASSPPEVVRAGWALRSPLSSWWFPVGQCLSRPHSPCKHWVLLTEMLASKFLKRNQWVLIYPWVSQSLNVVTWVVNSTKLSVLCFQKCCRCSTFITYSLQSFCELRYEYEPLRPTNKMTEPSSENPRAGSYLKIIEARLLLTD